VPAAPVTDRLWLLPSGPDQVHGATPHGAASAVHPVPNHGGTKMIAATAATQLSRKGERDLRPLLGDWPLQPSSVSRSDIFVEALVDVQALTQ
jgi:hypothetical protein